MTALLQLLDLRTAAQHLSVSRRTLQRGASILPTVRIGGRGKRFVDFRDVEQLIAKYKIGGGE